MINITMIQKNLQYNHLVKQYMILIIIQFNIIFLLKRTSNASLVKDSTIKNLIEKLNYNFLIL